MGTGFLRHVGLATRTMATIRMWPQLPSDREEAEEWSALAVTCLERGVAWENPALLIQAGLALSRPAIKATMCAESPCCQVRAIPPWNAVSSPQPRVHLWRTNGAVALTLAASSLQ